jgi:hypothetical protein
LTTAYTKVVMTNKVYDTHGAYSSGTFTAPIAGTYVVSCITQGTSVAHTAITSQYDMVLYKTPAGGAAALYTTMYYHVAGATGSQRPYLAGTAHIKLNAGDAIDVRNYNPFADNALSGSSTTNVIRIARVGM